MDKWSQLSVQNKTERMPKNASGKRWDTLLLSDALCLVLGLADPPHPTRNLGALSSAIPTTSTPTAFPSTAIVALRAGSSRLAHLATWHSRRNYPLR